jgi:fluoride ion exporter CrcB/FEX
METPRHHQPSHPFLQVAAVLSGGFLGSGLRFLGTKVLAPRTYDYTSWFAQIPWSLLIINFVGVLVASMVLLRILESHNPDGFPRLVVITGFLGGFTSYSGLIVYVDKIWEVSVVGAFVTGLGAFASGMVAFLFALWWSKRT